MKRIAVPVGVAAAVCLAGPAAAVPTVSDAVGAGGVQGDQRWESVREARIARATMDPVGTTRSPEKAVNRLMDMVDAHVGGYWGACQRLADDAYMPKGPRVGSALEQWQRARKAGVAHPDDGYPPIGAQMFWRTENPAWHVATYVGEGRVVTNMSDGSVKAIKWTRLNEWGPYLGWAPPYYKQSTDQRQEVPA